MLFPFAIGIIGTVLLLARLVNHLFDKHYGIAFYCVIGFVIASTIPIIPISFTGFGEAALCVLAVLAGFAGSFFMDRWSEKHPAKDIGRGRKEPRDHNRSVTTCARRKKNRRAFSLPGVGQ